ncbi:hypothetical protein LCGC14_1964940 [marine sediment metagenome]|uniref:Carrier domain-containing protein n=1 Tax=marine sediment metagenome TaxID=412755 RepID=A0A0F9G1U5_9ZZZZ
MTIEEKVKSIIAFLLDIEESKIKLSDNLIDTLDFDSMDIVEFMMRLEEEFNIVEEEFNIEILDLDFYRIITVKDVINYIEKNNETS